MSVATSTAIGIAGAVAAGGGIASSIIGSNAAGKAADSQAGAANYAATLQKQAADQALVFQKQQYADTQRNIAPWLQTGTGALGNLAYLMGIRTPPPATTNSAPQNPTGNGSGVVGGPDIQDILNNIRNRNGAVGGPRPMTANSAMLPAGQNPLGPSNGVPLPTGNPGTAPFNMNPPITSPGTGGTQFQMKPPITSGGTTGQVPTDVVPGALGGQGGAAALNGGTGTDANPFPNGLGNLGGTTNDSTNQGGTGQVPQTGGNSLSLNPPINGTGEAMFNPNDPNQGLPPGSSTSDGGFGSLMQSYGEKFAAPTNITEQNDPGYKFRLQQGSDAIERSAAARGGLITGGTSKSLSDYNQNSASNEYSNTYNRALGEYQQRYNIFQQDQANKFNRLADLSGLGQTAAGQLSSAGSTSASNIGNILLGSASTIGNDYQNAAGARASGYVGGANAITGAIGNSTNSLSGLLSLYQLMKANGAGGAGGGGV